MKECNRDCGEWPPSTRSQTRNRPERMERERGVEDKHKIVRK